MKRLTLEEYNNISNDYKGVFMDHQGNAPYLKGKRTILQNGKNGSELMFEGIDFIIIEEEKIKVVDITETTYEDGTQWIIYEVGGKYGYEIGRDLDKSDIKPLEEIYNDNKKLKDDFINKKNISDCDIYLVRLIEECRQSDNEMWFLEYEDINEFFKGCQSIKNQINIIQQEVDRLGLNNYIRFFEDDCLITVYGDIITKFLF